MKLKNAVGNISDLLRRLPLIVRAVAAKNGLELVPAKPVALRATRRWAGKSLDATATAANFTKQSTKRIYGTHE